MKSKTGSILKNHLIYWNGLVAKSCPTLVTPWDCSLRGSSVHGVLQPKIFQWVVISFFRGSSQPRNGTQVSCNAGSLYWLSYTGSPLIYYIILTAYKEKSHGHINWYRKSLLQDSAPIYDKSLQKQNGGEISQEEVMDFLSHYSYSAEYRKF